MFFGIIVEMHYILLRNFIKISIIYGHVRQQFIMIEIIGDLGVPGLLHDLLHTHAVVIVLERYARTLRAHLLQLAAGLPRVRPRPIVQRVANRIVGDRLAIVTGQLVFPVAVAVDVGDRFNRRSDCARGVSVFDLGSDVSAAVVVVHPGRVLMRIVHTDQLSQRVVLICRGQVAALFAGDPLHIR